MADLLDDLFSKIRAGVTLLSADDIELVARQINKTKTEALLVEALETFENRQKEDEEWEAFHARTFRQEVKDDLRLSRLGSVQADVETLLKGGDLSVDADSAVFKQLCRAALKGLDEFYLNAEIIVRGQLEHPRLSFPEPARDKAEAPSPAGGLTFEVVQKKYLDDYRSVWSEKQYSSQAAKIDYFLSYLTELDGLDGQQRTLASVSTAQARSYKEHLQKAPSNAKKKYPGLSPQAAVDAAAADHAQVLSQTTQNNYLQSLSTLYAFAASELDYAGTNPFKGRGNTKAAKVEQRTKRDAFSREQLIKLFSSPLFVGCKSVASCHIPGGIIPIESHKYWVPLIGIHTGMRVQEILQLYVEDLYQRDGIWLFDLNTNHSDKRLKTPQSKRLVPIHDKLVQMGLLEFWEKKQQSGHQRLFEDAPLASDGTYSSTFSKWFSRYLSNLGIKTEKTSFHSLRHNVKDFFRQVGESDELSENLMGRSTGSTGEAYGSGFSVERSNEALQKINLDEFMTNRISLRL